jgi:hypothetical protein
MTSFVIYSYEIGERYKRVAARSVATCWEKLI